MPFGWVGGWWFSGKIIPLRVQQLKAKKSFSWTECGNNLDIEKEKGVAIKLIRFPGSPHWEKCDFLIFLINLATSNGDVLLQFKDGIPSLRYKFGTGSLGLFTEDFDHISH